MDSGPTLRNIGIIICILGLALSIYYLSFTPVILFILGFVIVIYSRSQTKTEKSWSLGLEAEKQVLKYLNTLKPEYSIFNDVKFDGSREYVDHVVVGSNGIFVVETKNYTGMYTVKNNKWYYVENGKSVETEHNPGIQVMRSAEDIKNLIKNLGYSTDDMVIVPIVAFIDSSIEIIEPSDDYYILSPIDIPNFILQRNTTQNMDKINMLIYELERLDYIKRKR